MSEWFDNTKQSTGSVSKLLHKLIEKANLRSELTSEEGKRLKKLQVIADKLKLGENALFILLTNL